MSGAFNLSKDVKVVRVQNAAVAGTTNLTGSTVDTIGFDSVMFIYGVGALTSTQVTQLKAQSGSDSGGSGAADIAGTKTTAFADADGNKLVVLDLVRCMNSTTASSTSAPSGTDPSAGYGGGYTPFRYVTPVLLRGTANAVVDFGIAILYNQRKRPLATQDATVSSIKTVIDAIPGTA